MKWIRNGVYKTWPEVVRDIADIEQHPRRKQKVKLTKTGLVGLEWKSSVHGHMQYEYESRATANPREELEMIFP